MLKSQSKSDQKKITIILLVLGSGLIIFGVRLNLIETLSYYVPYYDDWGMGGTISLFESKQLTLSHMTKAWNGHMVFWSKLLNFFIFEANQEQWDTQLMMCVNAFIWSLTGTFLIYLCAHKLKGIKGTACAALVLIIWVFPTSLPNTLWGVQTHNYLMILFSVLAMWYCCESPYSAKWYLGFLFTFAASLTMGGGALVSIAIFTVAVFRYSLLPDLRPQLKPTVIVSGVLTFYSLCLLVYSSGDQDAYKANSVIDFLSTFLKTLSFPYETTILPSLLLVLPITIVGLKALYQKLLSTKTVTFALTLFVYTIGIAITIAYIRGANGGSPSVRYFEFLQLYIVACFLGLLLLQTSDFEINKIINHVLVFAWIAVFSLGSVHQISLLNSQLEIRSVQKPKQQKLLREYLVTNDINVLRGYPNGYLPFASAEGLVSFTDKLKPFDMLHYYYQVPPELVAENANSVFINNGTIRPSVKKRNVLYRHENTKGSFHPETGVKATGNFVSQLIETKRSTLMIPVMGYLGFPELSLLIKDELTGEITDVKPNKVDSKYAEVWREIYIDAPKNPFRLIANDNNEQLWFGFAMPRTVGRLTMISKTLMSKGKYLWQIGVLLIFLCLLKPLISFIQPNKSAKLS